MAPSNPKSYVTLLSTENYLAGVLTLSASLKKTRPQHPFVVLIHPRISGNSEDILKRNNIRTLRIENVPIPEEFIQVKQHWTRCFDKLPMFWLKGFKKVVYLDSDMMIFENLDHLFNLPHLSGTTAGRSFPGNESWTGINGGLMVIEPNPECRSGLLTSLGHVLATMTECGDQDVIQKYYNWPDNPDLVISETYNVLSIYLDYYLRNKENIFQGQTIKVVHFIGAIKPWMQSPYRQVKHLLCLLRKAKFHEAQYYLRYLLLLYKTRYSTGVF